MTLLFSLFLTFAYAHEGQHMNMDKSRPQPISGESVYNVDAGWKDQNGADVHLSELKGAPVVLAMVYTSCQAACPLIVSNMQTIESKLPASKREKTQFVLVSFDSKRDTVKKLHEFAKARKLDLKHWRLLTGSNSGIRELAAVLGVKYRREKNGDYSHSNVITALDAFGVQRAQKVGLDSNDRDFMKALNRL